jgi:hypothetical protein
MAPDRFVATGSGRCGTKLLSELLTAAGVRCGHERVFGPCGVQPWGDLQADSSWMAATMLDAVDVPVVLLVRHPLAVVRSWVEIGFFSQHDAANPTHEPLRQFAPGVYDDHASPADRALEMWCRLNAAVLPRAEMVLRLEHLDADQLARLLRWAGADPAPAGAAYWRIGRVNRHEGMRQRVGISHQPTWSVHQEDLADEARRLARLLGYDPEVIPGG